MTDETLFRADWVEAVFLHYRVPPEALQPAIPFPLDLRDGAAWVSLVAFRMERMRPAWGGRAGEWLLSPLSPCRFLNVRTYVRHGGEPGIYFIREWITNRLCLPLGPASFGLPYRDGRLEYRHEGARLAGEIAAVRGGGRLSYAAEYDRETLPLPCDPDSLGAFLLERYTAFTRWAGLERCFRIHHEPWEQWPLRPVVRDDGLLARAGSWSREAELAGGHYSPGAFDVRIGWPRGVRTPAKPRCSGYRPG